MLRRYLQFYMYVYDFDHAYFQSKLQRQKILEVILKDEPVSVNIITY